MKKDLRILFNTNIPTLDAHEIFVDREDERKAFERAFHAYENRLVAGECDPENVVAPRTNLIVFHGLGGIGKTTLSRQLEAWLTADADRPAGDWPARDQADTRLVTTRLNLSREAGLDFETMIIRLRAAAACFGEPLAAFDVCFARYWALAHPNEDFTQFLQRQSALSRVPGADGIVDQVATTLAGLTGLLGPFGAAAGVLALTGRALVGAIRGRVDRNHVLTSCPRLADLLEADADVDALGYYSFLLAWDLQRLQKAGHVRLVVFLDTFEEAGTRDDRQLERLIQRLVWLMPNVFFVVTGRNRLDWADPQLFGQLDWVGPVSWPGLALGQTEEPRQHLVGTLSGLDADRFLRNRLSDGGRPFIPDEVREHIVANAGGLPLFLDLCVMRFMQIHSAGRVPSGADFDAGFPALVARVFRDLTPDERTALRAVSLLDSFDVRLAAAAAGLSSTSAVVRLVDRPFVHLDPHGHWPYHLDASVRSAITEADHGLDDSWGPTDWAEAAGRALAAMRGMREDAGEQHDRRTLINCLNQGLRLSHEYGLDAPWLVDAAYRFVTDHVWEPTLRPRVPGMRDGNAAPEGGSSPITTPAQALAIGLVGVVERQRTHRAHTEATLARCLDYAGLDDEARDLIGYFHAESLRDLGRVLESEAEMRTLVGPGRRMSDAAVKGLVHLNRRAGRFRRLHTDLLELPAVPTRSRLTGDLCWTQALFDDADSHYAGARDQARAEFSHGEAALSESCRAFAAGFGEPVRARHVVRSARDMLVSVTITWADIHVAIAELLADAGADPAHSSRCDTVAEAARAAGLSSSAAYVELARAFDASVRLDLVGLATARHNLTALVDPHQFGYLLEIVGFWADTTPTSDDATGGADWVDGRRATAERWRAVLEHRRATTRPASP